jgi:DNA repair/transcription protein MET18/MMS19
LPVADLSSFLHRILWWNVKHGPEDVKTRSAYDILTSVVNKHADGACTFFPATAIHLTHTRAALLAFLAAVPGDFSTTSLDTFWLAYVANREVTTCTRVTAIHAWARVANALIARNHKTALSYAERLFTLFGDADADVVAEAARAIGDIPATNVVLTKANHAVIRVSACASDENTRLTDAEDALRTEVLYIDTATACGRSEGVGRSGLSLPHKDI